MVRHIQLKSTVRGRRRAKVGVHTKLAEKPGGCVVWIFFRPETMELGPFLLFGAGPGAPLPDIAGFPIGKHAKGNSEGVKAKRPSIRNISKGHFETLDTVRDVVRTLFGITTAQ